MALSVCSLVIQKPVSYSERLSFCVTVKESAEWGEDREIKIDRVRRGWEKKRKKQKRYNRQRKKEKKGRKGRKKHAAQ